MAVHIRSVQLPQPPSPSSVPTITRATINCDGERKKPTFIAVRGTLGQLGLPAQLTPLNLHAGVKPAVQGCLVNPIDGDSDDSVVAAGTLCLAQSSGPVRRREGRCPDVEGARGRSVRPRLGDDGVQVERHCLPHLTRCLSVVEVGVRDGEN